MTNGNIRQCHNNALILAITIIKGRTFKAKTKGLFTNISPKTNLVPSAVADDNFATPALITSKKPATEGLSSIKANKTIAAIAAIIFLTFIALKLLESGTAIAVNNKAPNTICK